MDLMILIALTAGALALNLAPRWPGREAGPEIDGDRSTDSLRTGARRLGPGALRRTIDRYVAYLCTRERLLREAPLSDRLTRGVQSDIARARHGLACYLDESRRRGRAHA